MKESLRKLEDIGFYTLSDERARMSSVMSQLYRGELIVTSRCNLACHYCRPKQVPDIDIQEAEKTIRAWAGQGLFAIRFSGGEPTHHPRLSYLAQVAKKAGIEKIAISTNGTAPAEIYLQLLDDGVNDFSVSFDACCAADFGKMCGKPKLFERVLENIGILASKTYVTLGVVLTERNAEYAGMILAHAKALRVADVRLIPSAQSVEHTLPASLEEHVEWPIFQYRLRNAKNGIPVRGLGERCSENCNLVLDDMLVVDGMHYPCVVYWREGGEPIGEWRANMDSRHERATWRREHAPKKDPICKANCLDVCRDYNLRWDRFHEGIIECPIETTSGGAEMRVLDC